MRIRALSISLACSTLCLSPLALADAAATPTSPTVVLKAAHMRTKC